jgi:hypothetical protein
MSKETAFTGIHHLVLTTGKYDETEDSCVQCLGLPVSCTRDTKNAFCKGATGEEIEFYQR